jgi:hypothetical protein
VDAVDDVVVVAGVFEAADSMAAGVGAASPPETRLIAPTPAAARTVPMTTRTALRFTVM